MKTLTCMLLAMLLAGCLPIGIRGTNLPNYASTPQPDAANGTTTPGLSV